MLKERKIPNKIRETRNVKLLRVVAITFWVNARLKMKIENKSTFEGAFYPSE